MLRKALVTSVLATALAAAPAGVAWSATDVPVAQAQSAMGAVWVPTFYFGTQVYCFNAAAMGQQMGVLQAGRWTCDSGWLMTLS